MSEKWLILLKVFFNKLKMFSLQILLVSFISHTTKTEQLSGLKFCKHIVSVTESATSYCDYRQLPVIPLLSQKWRQVRPLKSCIAICGKAVTVSDIVTTDNLSDLIINLSIGTIANPLCSLFPEKWGSGPQNYITDCRHTVTVSNIVTTDDL